MHLLGLWTGHTWWHTSGCCGPPTGGLAMPLFIGPIYCVIRCFRILWKQDCVWLVLTKIVQSAKKQSVWQALQVANALKISTQWLRTTLFSGNSHVKQAVGYALESAPQMKFYIATATVWPGAISRPPRWGRVKGKPISLFSQCAVQQYFLIGVSVLVRASTFKSCKPSTYTY